MRTLWNIYTKVLIGIILAVLIGAGGVNYYTKTQSDAKYYAKTQADTTFVKVADLVTPISFDTLNITDKATAPTMPTGTRTTDVSTTTFSNEAVENYHFNFLKANGQPKLLGVPMFAATLLAGTRAMADGTMYICAYKMTKDTVITSLTAQMLIQGSYTGDNYNGMMIYRTSSSGITLAAKTTNNVDIWKGAAGALVTANLESTVSVTKGEIIMIGAVYNSSGQTTAPTIYSFGSVGAYVGQLLTYTRKIAGNVAGVTTPGASYLWGSILVGSDLVAIFPK